MTRSTRVRATRIPSRIRSRAWTLRWPSPWNGDRARSVRIAASSCASDCLGGGPRPGVFDGAIDGERFRAYIDQILVPTLHPGDIVIADNLGAHKVAGIQRAIQAAGATLWYLPPYSPDLNPIELCFAKLKALVRTAPAPRLRTAE